MNSREHIVTIMKDCFVSLHSGSSIPDSFVTDDVDVAMSELAIDSLAAVQVCVELENRLNWSISPKALLSFSTLGELAAASESSFDE